MKNVLRYSVAAAILVGMAVADAPLTGSALAQQAEQPAQDGIPPIPMEKIKKKKKQQEGAAEEGAAKAEHAPQQVQEQAPEQAGRKKRGEGGQQAEGKRRKKRDSAQSEPPSEPAPEVTAQPEPAPEQPPQQVQEQAPVQQQAEPTPPAEEPAAAPASGETAEPKDGNRRKRREATTETQQQPEMAPVVSKEAEKPEEIVLEPITEQVKQAEKEQTAIVPDNITTKDREQLKKAERKRREKAREDRGELLGAAAVGAVVGALIPQLGGTVAVDEGDRIVVERDGRYYVRKDESALLRYGDADVRYERMRDGMVREIVTRPNGVQIISVKDPGGNVIRRVRVNRDGSRVVLFDSLDDYQNDRYRYTPLPDYRVDIPRDRYIVSARRADRRMYRDTFLAEPVYEAPQRYSLREIQEYAPVRNLVRRVDLDTINFDSGSAYVGISQVQWLGDMAGGMLDVIAEQPDSVFLLEGHTDAVGSELSNLTLSDRRAESVARILIEAYGIPPENLVTQGYGEQYLKVQTELSERENRRVTIRNITPILEASSQ